jgi:hypothetical protein
VVAEQLQHYFQVLHIQTPSFLTLLIGTRAPGD